MTTVGALRGGAVLGDHFVRPWPDDTGNRCFSAGGLVSQDSPHVLRRFGVGAQRVVGTCDFLRVALGHRDGKSPQGLHGALNRCALMCSLTAKVERRRDCMKIRIGVEPVPHQAQKTASQGSISAFRATEDPPSGLLRLLFIQSRRRDSRKFAKLQSSPL
jgi:hypothetical protein